MWHVTENFKVLRLLHEFQVDVSRVLEATAFVWKVDSRDLQWLAYFSYESSTRKVYVFCQEKVPGSKLDLCCDRRSMFGAKVKASLVKDFAKNCVLLRFVEAIYECYLESNTNMHYMQCFDAQHCLVTRKTNLKVSYDVLFKSSGREIERLLEKDELQCSGVLSKAARSAKQVLQQRDGCVKIGSSFHQLILEGCCHLEEISCFWAKKCSKSWEYWPVIEKAGPGEALFLFWQRSLADFDSANCWFFSMD